MIEAPIIKRTFLDDVSTIAKSLEETLRSLRLREESFTTLEDLLTNQQKPTALNDDLLNLSEFITLAGEYLKLVPLDVSLGLTNHVKARTRGPHEALRNQYVGNNLFGKLNWNEFYNDPIRNAIDTQLTTLETNLNSFGTILTRHAVQDIPGQPFIPLGGINHSYIGSLRVQAYRNAGLRLYEDPERMFTLSFRALALKRGWINRTTQGSYQLAKDGSKIIQELHNNNLTEQLFEQYTGVRVNLTPIPLPPVQTPHPPAISGGTSAGSVSDFAGRRIIAIDRASTWAQGYHALRACVVERDNPHPRYEMNTQTGPITFYRPLTFGENLRARIVDAQAHNNNVGQAYSWNRPNDSCTAIIYGHNGKFKVQTISRDLLDLAPDFGDSFVQKQYNSVDTDNGNAMEFNRRSAKYNELLTREEVLCHPFWQFVADGNIDVLRDYTQLQWAGKKADYKGMGVWISDSPQNGELRALYVDNRNYNSNAYGSYYLYNNGFFLRVS